jgi:hypothetical protein
MIDRASWSVGAPLNEVLDNAIKRSNVMLGPVGGEHEGKGPSTRLSLRLVKQSD